MTTRQRILVDPDRACDYHLVSRCVRAGFLSGYDACTQRDYSYRKRWVVERLETLVCCFAVSLYGHSVKSDHFHLVVRYDPQGCHEWSDEEVARRWVDALQPMGPGREMQRRRQKTYAATLADPARRERARRALGSLAAFMKHLKQPISRRANLEDHSQGRFFEQGFYSGALLNEEALEAAMAYVDLSHLRGMLETRIVARSNAPMAGRLKVNSAKALAVISSPHGSESISTASLIPAPRRSFRADSPLRTMTSARRVCTLAPRGPVRTGMAADSARRRAEGARYGRGMRTVSPDVQAIGPPWRGCGGWSSRNSRR